MNENIFRAYDIRGNAEQDLTPDVLIKIGFVLGNKVKDSGSDAIYVGHDSRPAIVTNIYCIRATIFYFIAKNKPNFYKDIRS